MTTLPYVGAVSKITARLRKDRNKVRVRFSEIHLSLGGSGHEHIEELRAVDAYTGVPYQDTRSGWVAYVEQGNTGFVRDVYGNEADVYVNKNGYVKWIQTHADSRWTDNLLALPRY